MVPILLLFAAFTYGLRQVSDHENAVLSQSCGLAYSYDSHIRVKRIWGGHKVHAGYFPWAAALSHNGETFCGATLVSSRHLITAGHCFYHGNRWLKPFQITVHLGGACVQPDRKFCIHSDMQDFQVDKFWRNPTHTDAKQTGRDFGIILLKEPVQFSSRIAPACLPGSSTPLPDQIFVYGFGKHSMVLYDTERQPLENPRFQRLFVARVKQRKCKGMKMERFSDSFLATFCVIPYKGDGGPSMGDSGSGIMGKVGPKNQTVVFGNTVVAFMAEGHIVDNRSYVQDICRKIGLCYTLCDDVEKCLVI